MEQLEVFNVMSDKDPAILKGDGKVLVIVRTVCPNLPRGAHVVASTTKVGHDLA